MFKNKNHTAKIVLFGISSIFGFVVGSNVNVFHTNKDQENSTAQNKPPSPIAKSSTEKICHCNADCKTCYRDSINATSSELLAGGSFGNIEKYPKEILHLDITSQDAGGLGNRFSMAVGLTPFEEKEVENIIHEYGEKLKLLQLERLVPIESSEGLKFMIPSFVSEGENLKGEFITKIRNTLDESTYLRFMAYGVNEIYSKIGDFGESKFEFSFQNDNGESVLNVRKGEEGNSGEISSRFIGSSIPSIYAHLFTFDEQNN